MLRFFERRGCGNGMNLEASRIEGPAEPADYPSFAGCIPALENDHRMLSRSEIGLLDQLKF
jgi:hypothetical protein